MVQLCWTHWKFKNVKLNLLCDKDIPCVRSDKLKHNQLLRLLLDYSFQVADESSDILLTVSRAVIVI